MKFGGTRIGTIHLKRDTCYRYWGYLKLNEPLDTDSRATAGLVWQNEFGPQPGITCNSPGGNGFITTGQTSCYTRRISRDDGIFTFQAFAHEDFQNLGEGPWVVVAQGKTVQVSVEGR
ncbi:hypothetical protein ABZS29_07890 [Kribbella sp. NPDC005582]|uniref:hypothetical protein n=1 Tax=Kribbella sp. NPDC005582 TaxID=3156893 RepID=UPI0033A5CE9E